MSRTDFSRFLYKAGANLDKWGRDGAGTIQELQSRVEAGFIAIEDGDILRMASMRLRIFYHDRRFLLLEDIEVALDASQAHAVSSAVGVTIACPTCVSDDGNGINKTISRVLAVRFKLDICEEDVRSSRVMRVKDTGLRPSLRYPGLSEVTKMRYIDYDLPYKFYEPDGYLWKRASVMTHYAWLPLTEGLQKGNIPHNL